MVNAQQWLDENYPKNDFNKKREEIIKLNIDFQNLEGHLDLSEFVNLKELDCAYNQLTSLNLSNCHKLTELACDNDQRSTLELIEELKKKISEMQAKIEQKKANPKLELNDEQRVLLEELIEKLVKFTKGKKQKQPVAEMRREYEKLFHELEDKISKEKMEEVEIILTDHEDIVSWELEIETLLSKCVNIAFPPKNGIKIISFDPRGKTITGTTSIENQQAQIQVLPKKY